MTDNVMEIIGQRIRKARQDLGITRRELAVKADVSSDSLKRYEEEQMEPRAVNLLHIADALGVSADWLMGRTDRKTLQASEGEEK